jgi:hypothetical protein
MTYEINEPLEVGDAGVIIQAPKGCCLDEVSGVLGPNQPLAED